MKPRIVLLACFSLMVWKGNAQSDALGVHNMYGRGCAACHAPHTPAVSDSGVRALWGQNLTPLYGVTVPAGGFSSRNSVSLPASALRRAETRDSNRAIIVCVSCHDGCMAPVGSTKGTTFEPVASGSPATLLGERVAGGEHPVGAVTAFGCGTPGKWDCSVSATGEVSMNGIYSRQFARNYGFPIAFRASDANGSTLTCTTCHDPHSETVWLGTIGGVQAQWRTSFFVRGPYTPAGATHGNAAAQFCRSCHAAQSNEMHGLMNVPTTGVSRL